MDIATEIQRAKEREWDQNEAALVAHLAPQLPPPPELDDETRRHLQPFLQWANSVNVRFLPAKPYSVAAFIFQQAANKVPASEILNQIAAVARLHDNQGLADVTASTPVRGALELVLKDEGEAPRSWRNEEKAAFWTLDKRMRNTIQRREHEREISVRRKQNELAEAIKEAKRPTTAADTKPVETTKETISHG